MAARAPLPPAPASLSALAQKELVSVWRCGARWRLLVHPHAVPELEAAGFLLEAHIPMAAPYSGEAQAYGLTLAGAAAARQIALGGRVSGHAG